MRNTKLLFWLIVILTILAILITLPQTIPISFDSPEIPIINRKISIHKTFSGFRLNGDLSFHKGLDLEGGTSITLKADMKGISKDRQKNALESAKAVIDRRINFFGVSEPIVQTSSVGNDYRIIAELPGVSIQDAIQLIGTTAQLSFWEEGAASNAASTKSDLASLQKLPVGLASIFKDPKKTDLTGSDLQQTSVTFDSNTGNPQVQLVFTPQGSKKFAEITKRNVKKRVAIVLDNQVIEAPNVNEPIITGNAVITGGFTSEGAKQLSVQLNAGSLPVPLSVLEQHSIGPTLGIVSLKKSLFAGVLGFIVIVIFMSILYKKLGVIASVALLLYTLYVLALFKIIPITLTLAGIAGFILSIGMAVDANILIFERMKEELRRGKNKNVAMERGFSRAWTSIRDSNVSSLITSFILYYFGTGQVKGFALTLSIGVLVSMFSAIVITRTFLRMTYKE